MARLRTLAKSAALIVVLGLAFWLALAGRAQLGSSLPASTSAAPAQAMLAQAETDDAPLVIPVAGVRPNQLVDTFTQARAAGARRHDAIDILAPLGTPVIAAAGGRVERLFVSADGGNTVYVRSLDGRRLYYYAHLQAYAPGLQEGAIVPARTPLGRVGSTGNADPAAPHLHFAVSVMRADRPWWEEATPINPFQLLARETTEDTGR